jgi:SAM-dependent methyltransferase
MSLKYGPYDQRGYPTVNVVDGYRLWSAHYDTDVTEDLDVHLLDRLETVSWAVDHAVDLACGTGRIGAWLGERGSRSVVGVDLTPEMVERARARGVHERVLLEDIRRTSLPDGAADLVTNVLSVEHLPELGPFYGEVARLLRPGGTAVVVGYHPHFLLNGIPTHFKSGGAPVAIENTIHLFSDHVAAARANDLALRELLERVVNDEWVARAPGFRRHLGRPVSFALVWQRS